MNKLPYPLDPYGRTETSQNDEDGIIAEIINHIPMRPYFVEFGAEPQQCNCLALHRQGWDGLFMDKRGDSDLIKIEWVSAANIMDLLRKYQVPEDFGLLSIDIDGQDYHVWQAIEYKPPLVVIEYNGKVANREFLMPRDDNFIIRDHNYGASLLSMTDLAMDKSYHLVYANGVNAFYVRRDLLANPEDFIYSKIYRAEGGFEK